MIKLGNKVMVSDPCYGLETWCQGVIKDVLPGNYQCEISYSDEGEWGRRVESIRVVHEDYEGVAINELEPFEVGVDSGQAGIFDYTYYKKYHTRWNENEPVDDNWYDMVCDITLAREQAGEVEEFGFVSSSGFGDGGYNCYVARERNGYVVAIEIVFIDKLDEDEEEEK